MSRYYLHMRDFKGKLFEDVEGAVFLGLAEAREEALRVMREFVSAAVQDGDDPPFESIELVDEQGVQVAAVPLVASLPFTVLGMLKQPEVVVPPDRFQDYRRCADECRGRAEHTDNTSDKTSWLRLANAWLLMLPIEESMRVDLAAWPKISDEDSTASH